MKRKALTILACAIGTVAATGWNTPAALADRGRIGTLAGKVDVEEPAQRAIIAHDGLSKEILILQTDLKADRKTKIVEFMPLPAKPEVSLAPEDCFKALQAIAEKHGLKYYARHRARRGNGPSEENGEGVKVVVSEQLGPHGITVVQVADVDKFIEWVREFFRKNDLGKPAVEEGLRQIVADYLKRDFKFFVFDIVEVSPGTKTVRPVVYRFRSPRLYYPMKVTNLYGGLGTVELLTILPAWIDVRFEAIVRKPAERASGSPQSPKPKFLSSNAVRLDRKEMASLHPAIPNLFGRAQGTLRAFKYEGPLQFDGDVWVRPNIGWTPRVQAFLQAVGTSDKQTLEYLVDVPFYFNGQTVLKDKEKLIARLCLLDRRTKARYAKYAKIQVPAGSGNALAVRELSEYDRRFVEGEKRLRKRFVSATRFRDGFNEMLFFLARRDDSRSKSCIVGFRDVNRFKVLNPGYRDRGGKSYEKQHLPMAVGQLAKAVELTDKQAATAKKILRTVIYDYLDSYVEGRGKIAREDWARHIKAMDERFKGQLSPAQYKLYLKWRKDTRGSDNALRFLMIWRPPAKAF